MALKLMNLEISAKLPAVPASLPLFTLAAPTFAERQTAIGRLGEYLRLGALRAVDLDHARILASERGGNITGQTINVDGGFVMHW